MDLGIPNCHTYRLPERVATDLNQAPELVSGECGYTIPQICLIPEITFLHGRPCTKISVACKISTSVIHDVGAVFVVVSPRGECLG